VALVGFLRAGARASIPRGFLAGLQLLGRALPVFMLAMLLVLVAIFQPWLAFGMSQSEPFDLRDQFSHLVLPVLSLAIPFGAWASLIFYEISFAAGTASRSLRSIIAAIPLAAALIGPPLLAASIMIEPMFAWPGMSRLYYDAILESDYGVVAGYLLAYCVCVVLIKLCSEFSPGMSDRALPQQPGSRLMPTSRTRRVSAAGIIASVVLVLAAIGAVSANLIAPVGPYLIDQAHWVGYPLAPGVAGHPLGTDENGRDLLARVLVGLRTSLGIASVATVVATAIAAVVAKATANLTWLDERGALSVTGIRPFAALPIIQAAALVLFARGYERALLTPLGIALTIAAVSWPAIVPAFRALRRATLGSVVGLAACALLLEVTLSAGRLGVRPPDPSLGNMLENAQSNLMHGPWIVLVPSVVVVALLFALYAIADELHDFPTLPTETE
jgi:peptide/nickel transport system permease protein